MNIFGVRPWPAVRENSIDISSKMLIIIFFFIKINGYSVIYQLSEKEAN